MSSTFASRWRDWIDIVSMLIATMIARRWITCIRITALWNLYESYYIIYNLYHICSNGQFLDTYFCIYRTIGLEDTNIGFRCPNYTRHTCHKLSSWTRFQTATSKPRCDWPTQSFPQINLKTLLRLFTVTFTNFLASRTPIPYKL